MANTRFRFSEDSLGNNVTICLPALQAPRNAGYWGLRPVIATHRLDSKAKNIWPLAYIITLD